MIASVTQITDKEITQNKEKNYLDSMREEIKHMYICNHTETEVFI